jgi:hypothetical protein
MRGASAGHSRRRASFSSPQGLRPPEAHARARNVAPGDGAIDLQTGDRLRQVVGGRDELSRSPIDLDGDYRFANGVSEAVPLLGKIKQFDSDLASAGQDNFLHLAEVEIDGNEGRWKRCLRDLCESGSS